MNTFEIIISILAVITSLIGVLGTVIPALPGILLCVISMVTTFFLFPGTISLWILLTMLGIFVALSLLDFFAPIFLTKWLGGSKKAMWGVSGGVIVGLFFLPWGMIVAPLAGAFIGEYWSTKSAQHSMKVAAYSFLSFMLTTGLNFITALLMTYFTCHAICQQILG